MSSVFSFSLIFKMLFKTIENEYVNLTLMEYAILKKDNFELCETLKPVNDENEIRMLKSQNTLDNFDDWILRNNNQLAYDIYSTCDWIYLCCDGFQRTNDEHEQAIYFRDVIRSFFEEEGWDFDELKNVFKDLNDLNEFNFKNFENCYDFNLNREI